MSVVAFGACWAHGRVLDHEPPLHELVLVQVGVRGALVQPALSDVAAGLGPVPATAAAMRDRGRCHSAAALHLAHPKVVETARGRRPTFTVGSPPRAALPGNQPRHERSAGECVARSPRYRIAPLRHAPPQPAVVVSLRLILLKKDDDAS